MHTYVSLMLLSILPILLSVKASVVEAPSRTTAEQRVATANCDYPCSDRGSGRRDFKRSEEEADKARGSGRRETEVQADKLADFS